MPSPLCSLPSFLFSPTVPFPLFPAFASFALPFLPQPTSASPRRDCPSIHMVVPQGALQGGPGVVPSPSLCPPTPAAAISDTPPHTPPPPPPGAHTEKQDLPAPKLGLAAFHRLKHIHDVQAHAHTPIPTPMMCAHTPREPLPTGTGQVDTFRKKSQNSDGKGLHFSKSFCIPAQRQRPHTLPHPILSLSPPSPAQGSIRPQDRLVSTRKATFD